MSGGNGIQPLASASGRKRRGVGAVVGLAALLIGSRAASGTPACPGVSSFDELQSRYEIVKVEKFRGGLTSREVAEADIGLEVVILPSHFRFGDVIIERPAYERLCYPVPAGEGEVDPHRWSNFYGFRTERRFIEVLAVHEPDSSHGPRYRFEVIAPDELWRTYDGWLFTLRKSGCPCRLRAPPRIPSDREVDEPPDTP